MKKTAMIFSLAFALAAAGALWADSAQSSDDTVTLKDGRILHGQVVEESNDDVVVLVQGVQRKFGRSFIKKIVYGKGPDEALASPAPAQSSAPAADGNPYAAPSGGGSVPDAPKGDMVSDLALRYKVPVSDVIWVRKQGISDADLPLVFLVAATAQVMPRAVVKLRLEGWAWDDIETHFGMNSQYIYYDDGPWGPYPYYYYPGWWGGWGWGWGGGWRGGWGGHYGGGHWGGGHWH
ncbi:MAG TPA: hypothetical protein VK914_06910 [bacterium]|nr:hypothetical protein [bacterium]